MQSSSKIFTVDKFLGINESPDGETELKMGEASRMDNWLVTDGFNLTLRPGIRRVTFGGDRDPQQIIASWAGFVGDNEYFILCDFDGEQDRLWVYERNTLGVHALVCRQDGALGLTSRQNPMVKIYTYAGKLFVMSKVNTVLFSGNEFVEAEVYVPKVIVGSPPAGGGTNLENINMLSSLRRMDFSADGTSTAYVLPTEATAVTEITIDNVPQTISAAGSFSASTHTFTFNTAPVKGVGNVEFTYDTDHAATDASHLRVASMPLAEAYNGSTDTRLFIAGDGSNICYYTGVPESGDLTKLYFPSMNEVAVDMSDSPITGLVRHYSKLLVFKPDGAYSISYEPVTLTGGDTIAGFFLRNVNKEFGHDVLGQVQSVNNYPRTISRGGIYEWRITSSYYKDERYAKRISDLVRRTIENADLSKVITCDDNVSKTYYLFLNDDEGTVLVNRYALTNDGIWCIYHSPRCRGVQSAFMSGDVMVFCGEKEAFYFETSSVVDAPENEGGEPLQITALWESGYMSFGADFRRKYSSQIYISILPSGKSRLIITASTDRREEYMEKEVSTDLFSWKTVTFPTWTWNVDNTPKINRVRLKVKKFVYYKLILKVEEPGATATVLGYDQQVRYSSMAK